MSDPDLDEIDIRLRELRQATKGKVCPSPELFARIESSQESETPHRWPQVMALTAVVLAFVAFFALQPRPQDEVVSTRPATREEFVAAMNDGCLKLIAEWQPSEPGATLSRSGDYAPLALERFLERITSTPAPSDAAELMREVQRNAVAALSFARVFAASSGERDQDSRPLSATFDALLGVGRPLAAYGVEECRDLPRRMFEQALSASTRP